MSNRPKIKGPRTLAGNRRGKREGYAERIIKAYRTGKVKAEPGTAIHAYIEHDDDCPKLKGGKRCRCNPDVYLSPHHPRRRGAPEEVQV